MKEPDNLTAWICFDGAVWVRVDSHLFGSWHLLRGDRLDVIDSSIWRYVEPQGPFVKADAALTRTVVDKVRQTLGLAS